MDHKMPETTIVGTSPDVETAMLHAERVTDAAADGYSALLMRVMGVQVPAQIESELVDEGQTLGAQHILEQSH
jgi:hypothetical protein